MTSLVFIGLDHLTLVSILHPLLPWSLPGLWSMQKRDTKERGEVEVFLCDINLAHVMLCSYLNNSVYHVEL